jgi:hypothetical protein
MDFLNIILEITNIRQNENHFSYFANRIELIIVYKYYNFETMNLINIIPQFINLIQRFYSFLIRFEHVADTTDTGSIYISREKILLSLFLKIQTQNIASI